MKYLSKRGRKAGNLVYLQVLTSEGVVIREVSSIQNYLTITGIKLLRALLLAGQSLSKHIRRRWKW